MAGPIHYEVYVRKTAPAAWTLLIATENRKQAIEAAEDQLRDRFAVASRVTKETLDPETMEFASVTILTLGAPEPLRKKAADAAHRPACSGPAELYSPHARALIGRVLEDWLRREGVTAFELLHRPDVAERLEAAGIELQHAIQKVAVPESQSTGQDVHTLVRHYHKLTEQAIVRLRKAGRDGLFPTLRDRSIADLAHRFSGAPDRAFRMGGVVAGALADQQGARARLSALMDLMDAAPADGPPRALIVVAVEQIVAEMLALRQNLHAVLGPGPGPGRQSGRHRADGGAGRDGRPAEAGPAPGPDDARHRRAGRAAGRASGGRGVSASGGGARPDGDGRTDQPPPPSSQRSCGRDRHPAPPGHGPDGLGRAAADAGGGADRLRGTLQEPGHGRFRRRPMSPAARACWPRPNT